ncbi:hypothetical protein [Nodosilinea sp. E11]|uniref:hypothetical protein n=1 Tax=Nodosilinea sp. E11 TaxID=3037479 RepID=UPI002934A954|nr:hypothetical protein [Nodosilinea sp. E11]WOD38996.1 hypothetical protein RRF56_22580 [Nodosilinea sp. E11]
MRLDSGNPVTRFFSSLVAILALVSFGFIAWKTFDVWQSDPAVKGIQQILQQQK